MFSQSSKTKNLLTNLQAMELDGSIEDLLFGEYHFDLESEEILATSEEILAASEEIIAASKEILAVSGPRVSKKRKYRTVTVYQSRAEAMQWLKENPIWSFVKYYGTADGRKEVYRCNLVKANGPQCNKVVKFEYNSETQVIFHLEACCSHTHEEVLRGHRKTGINHVTKEAIKNQIALGIRQFKTINQNLANEQLTNPDIKVPTCRQLSRFFQTLKKHKP